MNVVALPTALPSLATNAEGWVARSNRRPPRPESSLEALRGEAHRLLSIYPFPHRRFESWRHFPLRSLGKLQSRAPLQGPFDAAALDRAASILAGRSVTATVLVRGDTHGLAPGASFPDRVHAEPLAPRLEREGLGGHSLLPRREETFSALNAAIFREGIHLRVEAGAKVAQPLIIAHDAGAETAALLPRLRLVVEAGAEATLVEIFEGGSEHALVAPVTEVILEAGARLRHLRLQVEGEASTHLGSLEAVVGEGAVFSSRVFSLGAAASRLQTHATMTGPGASVTLEGVYLGRGAQHHEHHTWLEHAADGCQSEQTYRGILDGKSVAVFDGTIEIARGTKQSEGAMENRNLLLSDDAVVHTKPRLEIDADDVKCSHGATVGRLDEAQLFYLRSRGFGLEEARGLLTLAFVRELADRVEDKDLRALILTALSGRLPGVDATTLQAAEGTR